MMSWITTSDSSVGKLRCNRAFPTCDQVGEHLSYCVFFYARAKSVCAIQCHKRLREPECVYTERGLRYNTASQKADSMREKLDRLENFVTQLKSAQPDNTPVESRQLGVSHAAGQNDAHLSSSLGNLKLSESGGTQYFAPSHWESIIDDVRTTPAYVNLPCC